MKLNPFKTGDLVQLVNPPTDMYSPLHDARGKTFTVNGVKHRADGEPAVSLQGVGTNSWFLSNRFVLVGRSLSAPPPPTASARAVGAMSEDQLRAVLTTPSDPFVCPKCGAPKAACTYHSSSNSRGSSV